MSYSDIGRGAHTAQEKAMKSKAQDPVCGMKVKKEDAAATSQYRGVTYFFCSPQCKETFDADPEAFVS